MIYIWFNDNNYDDDNNDKDDNDSSNNNDIKWRIEKDTNHTPKG